MSGELTPEIILGAVDALLELSPLGLNSAGKLWPRLDGMLDGLLEAAEFDVARRERLAELMALSKTAATQLLQSMLNLRRGGPLRGDWARLAERDLTRLKDELLALREFLVAEADFIKSACLRARLRHPSGVNPETLFEELHRQGAISEHTWALLVSQPGKWEKPLKDGGLAQELTRISSWLLDLQDARRGRRWLESGRGK